MAMNTVHGYHAGTAGHLTGATETFFDALMGQRKPRRTFKRLVAMWNAFLVARRNRQEIKMLAAMPDTMLADIGVNRASVEHALAAPFWSDPSMVLVKRHRSESGRR